MDYSTNRSSSKTTAAKLISWLREKAADDTVKLRYCFLASQKQSVNHHKHPKGRPTKQGRMPLGEVQENMFFQDVLLSTQKIQTNSEITDRLP